jgi:hypothetical protein
LVPVSKSCSSPVNPKGSLLAHATLPHGPCRVVGTRTRP